ncbi:MAG: hypothetical protein ACUVR2_05970 [Anaerolineae bacterium]
MAKSLDRQAVKAWLNDQRAAAIRIAGERAERLLVLRPEDSKNALRKPEKGQGVDEQSSNK